MTVKTSEPLCAVKRLADVGTLVDSSSDFACIDRFEGEAGDLASGSENMRAPGDGCESHDGVWPMILGIVTTINDENQPMHISIEY